MGYAMVCSIHDSACVWAGAKIILTKEDDYGDSWDWCDWWWRASQGEATYTAVRWDPSARSPDPRPLITEAT